MSKTRILYLEDHSETYVASLELRGGFEAEVTALASSEIYTTHYRVSQFGRDLARRATPDFYDLVVIGNNRGTGCFYAELIPREMRGRTLIVWNNYQAGDEQPYGDLGFWHFCSREDQVDFLLMMLDEQVEFANPEDDTPENRDIVRLVKERSRSGQATDWSLEEVAAELGYELPKLVQRGE